MDPGWVLPRAAPATRVYEYMIEVSEAGDSTRASQEVKGMAPRIVHQRTGGKSISPSGFHQIQALSASSGRLLLSHSCFGEGSVRKAGGCLAHV